MAADLTLDPLCPSPPSAPPYLPRRPTQTVLFQTILNHLETFIDHLDATAHPLPRWLEDNLRAFLRCGQPQYGFVRVRCHHCKVDRAVPFSCKGRLCPSCAGRRMADLSAHWVDNMLPAVPIRQWVLTFPWPLRYRLAWDPELLADVLGVYLRVLFRWQRLQARRQGIKGAQCGAITSIQRFGSALNLNPHFHSIVPDGVFVRRGQGALFVRLPPPDDEAVAIVAATARRRVLRLLHRRGVIGDVVDEPDLLMMDEPSMACIYSASIQGRLALGDRAGQRVMRVGSRPGSPWVEMDSPQCARVEGFSLHAQVFIEAHERQSLERLCRYMTRPPISNERLTQLEDGRLEYQLKRPWSDGTRSVVFEPLEFLEKVVALMPRPWTHLVRYHGVFAPNAKMRPLVIGAGTLVPVSQEEGNAPAQDGQAGARGGARRVIPWAELIRRVFMVDVLCCPTCGQSMTIISVLTDPDVVEPFLVCIGVAPTPEVPAASRAPPWI